MSLLAVTSTISPMLQRRSLDSKQCFSLSIIVTYQHLITRNVPCTARVSSLENVVAVNNDEPGGCDGHDDGDWLVSHVRLIRADLDVYI